MMCESKDQMIEQVRQDARNRVARFSKEFVYAKSEDKEEIRAGMEFHRNMAEICDSILAPD